MYLSDILVLLSLLFETDVTRSIRPMSFVFHTRLISPVQTTPEKLEKKQRVLFVSQSVELNILFF